VPAEVTGEPDAAIEPSLVASVESAYAIGTYLPDNKQQRLPSILADDA
jgi:hypothetical protein